VRFRLSWIREYITPSQCSNNHPLNCIEQFLWRFWHPRICLFLCFPVLWINPLHFLLPFSFKSSLKNPKQKETYYKLVLEPLIHLPNSDLLSMKTWYTTMADELASRSRQDLVTREELLKPCRLTEYIKRSWIPRLLSSSRLCRLMCKNFRCNLKPNSRVFKKWFPNYLDLISVIRRKRQILRLWLSLSFSREEKLLARESWNQRLFDWIFPSLREKTQRCVVEWSNFLSTIVLRLSNDCPSLPSIWMEEC